MKILFKKIGSIIALQFCYLVVLTQTVEIHQIDVGAGDATLIKINNAAGRINILLDAGPRGAAVDVINYLKSPTGGNLGPIPYLDYVIASHYHEDHIGGLVGSKKRDITNCNLFYGILADGNAIPVYAVLDKGTASPVPGSDVYGDYGTLAGLRRVTVGIGANGTITPPAHIIPPPLPLFQQLQIGGYINLGVDANNVPIRLRLWAANGYVFAPHNAPSFYLNLADSNAVNRAHPGGFANPNNWGLAWVLEYGQFRYFTAGDIGGETTSSYFDIESPLVEQLPFVYTLPLAAPGHICAFKSDHHGSGHSTNTAFLDTLRPTVGIISCGNRHSHPTQETIDRMEAANWHAAGLSYNAIQNYYMTELHYTNDADTSRAITSGNIKYVVTNTAIAPPLAKDSVQMTNLAYLYTIDETIGGVIHGNTKLLVYPTDPNGIGIDQQSEFIVQWRNYNGGAWLAGWRYTCHQ